MHLCLPSVRAPSPPKPPTDPSHWVDGRLRPGTRGSDGGSGGGGAPIPQPFLFTRLRPSELQAWVQQQQQQGAAGGSGGRQELRGGGLDMWASRGGASPIEFPHEQAVAAFVLRPEPHGQAGASSGGGSSSGGGGGGGGAGSGLWAFGGGGCLSCLWQPEGGGASVTTVRQVRHRTEGMAGWAAQLSPIVACPDIV